MGGPKSRGVMAVAQAQLMPSSASAKLGTTRARTRTSAAPLAMATASSCTKTSAKRGCTNTRSEKPMTFMALAAAPTLPAWLVFKSTNRVGSDMVTKGVKAQA